MYYLNSALDRYLLSLNLHIFSVLLFDVLFVTKFHGNIYNYLWVQDAVFSSNNLKKKRKKERKEKKKKKKKKTPDLFKKFSFRWSECITQRKFTTDAVSICTRINDQELILEFWCTARNDGAIPHTNFISYQVLSKHIYEITCLWIMDFSDWHQGK